MNIEPQRPVEVRPSIVFPETFPSLHAWWDYLEAVSRHLR